MGQNGRLRRYHSWLSLGARLIDGVLAGASLYAAAVVHGVGWDGVHTAAALLAGLLTLLVMEALDLYRPWRVAHPAAEARVLVLGWVVVVAALLLIGFATGQLGAASTGLFGTWLVLAPASMLGAHLGVRALLRRIRRSGRNSRTAVIVGAGDLGRRVLDRIHAAPWMGIRVRGFFDDDRAKRGCRIDGVPVLGDVDDARRYVEEERIDLVYVALPMRAEERIRALLEQLAETTASVYFVPDIFTFDLLGARVEDMDGMPVLALCETPFVGPSGLVKRVEDLLLGVVLLVACAPLMALIALAIRLDSCGPVLFRQKRYGLDGKVIRVWKFRTMYICEDGEDFTQARRDDPRVTRVGRILRRTSLDELPQLFNVLEGSMSVVGPRPHPVKMNEEYRTRVKAYMWRHKVKPGITGWAQVNGWRGETDTIEKMRRRVEHDLEYIENWSLLFDLKILGLTVARALTGTLNRNAC